MANFNSLKEIAICKVIGFIWFVDFVKQLVDLLVVRNVANF